MNEVMADAQEKAQEALEARNEKMFEAHKDYQRHARIFQ
jgi:FtsZ-binding cell division protein ZapB